MKWYLAKIVFRIICGDGKHVAQFDEQLRLISAPDEEKAFEKAQDMGRKEQDSFLNLKKRTRSMEVCAGIRTLPAS